PGVLRVVVGRVRDGDEVVARARRRDVARDVDVGVDVHRGGGREDADLAHLVVHPAPDGVVLGVAEVDAEGGVRRDDEGALGAAGGVVLVAEGEGVAVGLDDGGLVAGGALDGDDLGLPVHAGHAGAVVPARGGGAGDVGAVERRGDGAVVVVGVPPVDVVDVAVPVVVDAVAGDLGGVRPEAEVGVAELEPVVDDGDGDAGAVGGDA